MVRSKAITGELLELKQKIESQALSYGLDFFETIFQECDYDTVNILAAQGGFPSRYPHWRFGMEYDQLSKGYMYGLQKIYEMVINTDPCYAYLLKSNPIIDQKIVMAHVYGHCDFFKNNFWFSNTNRKMMDVMANHGSKVRRYMDKYGVDEVEELIDRISSLENLLDIDVLFETPELQRSRMNQEQLAKKENVKNKELVKGSDALKSFLRAKNKESQLDKKNKNTNDTNQISKLPEKPERDILKFLSEYAPLKDWQLDVIGILREEAYYFLPQRMTKIMNEGWASYWHSKIMTEKSLDHSEIIDFADRHSGVTQMSRQNLNPYKIGIELMRDIEFRWNTGRFGKDYNECNDIREKENWNKNLNLGRQKIFEVRKTHNDITFIDEFLTEEFCNRHQIFTYKYNQRLGRYEIESKEFHEIKKKLLNSLTNFNSPLISIENANFKNRGEMLLVHDHYGVDLDLNFAQETMKNMYHLWSRPINIETISDGKKILYSFDGKDFKSLK